MLVRGQNRSQGVLAWSFLLAVSFTSTLACAIYPEPVTNDDQHAQAEADLELMFTAQEPLIGPLGFYEAVARAVKYNLDHRLVLMEQALASERVLTARLDLLPRLIANDEYFGRSNPLGSSSESISTGQQSLEASTSSERYGERTDLTLAWNLLDFGMSYVQAAQEANRELMAAERRAKVVQDLMVDVRRAYWQAAGAEQLIPEIDRLQREIAEALDDSEQLDAEGLIEPLEALTYQRELIEKARELESLRRKLELARIQLASLINVRPGDPDLILSDARSQAPRLDSSIEELEVSALTARPELREAAYEQRVSRLEVKKAMLSLLPGIELRIGSNSDDNDYLVHNDWFSYSALISKNLIQILSAPARIRLAQQGVDVAETRRLATGIGVLAQVHVAYRDYQSSMETLRFEERARSVEARAHTVTEEHLAGESQTGLMLIRSTANRLVAEMNYHQAYSDVQESYGRLLSSVGVLPPLAEEDVRDVAALSDRLRAALEGWGTQRGSGSAPLPYQIPASRNASAP